MDRLWPSSFLYPHLQWHGCAMPQCGVDAWHVRRCLWTSSWKGSTEHRAAICHLFFLRSTRWQCHHNTWKTLAGLWRWCNVKSTNLSLAKSVFWRRNSSWRWAAQRMTISNTDMWQHSTGKRTCSSWSKISSQNDCWWRETVRLIQSEELGMRKFVPRGCPGISPSNRGLSAIFDIQMHYGEAAASLLTWSRTLRLLFISKSKISCERTPFWVNRRHPEGCNSGLKRRPTKCVPGMLQRMAAPLEKVCAGTRVHFEGDHIVVEK